jgi:hypothetical protein
VAPETSSFGVLALPVPLLHEFHSTVMSATSVDASV